MSLNQLPALSLRRSLLTNAKSGLSYKLQLNNIVSTGRKRQPPHYPSTPSSHGERPTTSSENLRHPPGTNPTPESRNLESQPPTASSKKRVTTPRPQNPSCRNGQQQQTLPSTSQSNPGSSGQQIGSNCFFLRVNQQMHRIGSEACHLQTNLTKHMYPSHKKL